MVRITHSSRIRAVYNWLSAFGFNPVKFLLEYTKYWLWLMKGRPIPLPPRIKARIIKEYAKGLRLRTFVETGTYKSYMVNAVQHDFDRIYSIELNHDLHEKAKKRFAGKPNITILEGDSAIVLPELPAKMRDPCLFWLDAHTDAESPVLNELKAISKSPPERYVVLVDDVRLFGRSSWPLLQELQSLLGNFEMEKDIIVKEVDSGRCYLQSESPLGSVERPEKNGS